MLFKNSVRTEKKTRRISISKTRCLMLFMEMAAVNSKNHIETTNAFCGQNAGLLTIKSSDIYIISLGF
jgi:hypothetical protein